MAINKSSCVTIRVPPQNKLEVQQSLSEWVRLKNCDTKFDYTVIDESKKTPLSEKQMVFCEIPSEFLEFLKRKKIPFEIE